MAAIEIAGDPKRVSDWLGQLRRAAARGRQGRLGRARTARRASRRCSSRPVTGSSASDRTVVELRASRPRGSSPARCASPNIWEHPAVYEVENRAFDRYLPGRVGDAVRRVLGRPRPARPRLRHRVPPAALGLVVVRHGAQRRRCRAAPRAGDPRPATVPALPRVSVRQGSATAHPAAGRLGRRGAGPLGVLLRAPAASPACRELDRVVRRGGTAFVVDNDAHPIDVRRLVPPRLPGHRPGRRRAVLDVPRLDPAPGADVLAVRHPRRPRGRRPDRVRPVVPPTRCCPSTPAPPSTTPWTSGRRTSEGGPDSPERLTGLGAPKAGDAFGTIAGAASSGRSGRGQPGRKSLPLEVVVERLGSRSPGRPGKGPRAGLGWQELGAASRVEHPLCCAAHGRGGRHGRSRSTPGRGRGTVPRGRRRRRCRSPSLWSAPSYSPTRPATGSNRSGTPRRRPSRSNTSRLQTGGGRAASNSQHRRISVSWGERLSSMACRRALRTNGTPVQAGRLAT